MDQIEFWGRDVNRISFLPAGCDNVQRGGSGASFHWHRTGGTSSVAVARTTQLL